MGRVGLHGSRWSKEDDERLRRLWGILPLQELAEKFGRTCPAVRQHAIDLELDLGVAEGYLSLAAAARKAGYDHLTFRRAIVWYRKRVGEVSLTTLPAVKTSRCKGKWQQIDEYDAMKVAKAYTESELPSQASERLGVPPWTLRRRACDLGHKVKSEKHLRLMPEEWNQAAEGYRPRGRREVGP